jgi:hypothetical protein
MSRHMSRPATFLMLAAGCLVLPTAARAEEPAAAQTPPAKTEKAQPERVHLGATSVTVVDEHEAVDDVITRLRTRKTEAATAEKTKAAETRAQGTRTDTTSATRRGNDRASLRPQRDQAAARADADRQKDDRRERAANTRARLEQKQRR